MKNCLSVCVPTGTLCSGAGGALAAKLSAGCWMVVWLYVWSHVWLYVWLYVWWYGCVWLYVWLCVWLCVSECLCVPMWVCVWRCCEMHMPAHCHICIATPMPARHMCISVAAGFLVGTTPILLGGVSSDQRRLPTSNAIIDSYQTYSRLTGLRSWPVRLSCIPCRLTVLFLGAYAAAAGQAPMYAWCMLPYVLPYWLVRAMQSYNYYRGR